MRTLDSLSLGPILDGTTRLLRRSQPLPERVFPLVANRLTRPGSEHALATWLEDFYVVTAEASRWTPQWKASRRVKVSFEQLRLWYETLDDVLAGKTRIETAIWQELRDLFSIEPELVFYDITSTYFKGRGPAELGRFGYSRDGKPRGALWARQVVIGVVMMGGWPIAHHMFAGDRGMVTLKHLERLRQAGQGYLVGLPRRIPKDIPHYIEQAMARDRWQECPAGITASERAEVPRTRVREVAGKEPGVRVFVAALAFLLDRALEKKLRAAGSSLSSPAAWQALETVRGVAVEVGNRRKLCVTRGSRQDAEVLKILRLSGLDPPEPPKGKETAM